MQMPAVPAVPAVARSAALVDRLTTTRETGDSPRPRGADLSSATRLADAHTRNRCQCVRSLLHGASSGVRWSASPGATARPTILRHVGVSGVHPALAKLVLRERWRRKSPIASTPYQGGARLSTRTQRVIPQWTTRGGDCRADRARLCGPHEMSEIYCERPVVRASAPGAPKDSPIVRRARARRLMTVPMGTSRTVAASR